MISINPEDDEYLQINVQVEVAYKHLRDKMYQT